MNDKECSECHCLGFHKMDCGQNTGPPRTFTAHSVASENLKQQIADILDEVYQAGYTAQHERSARKGLTILGGVDAVLELIQRENNG